MDVKCATCGEPWDTYHLREDEVWETEAGSQMIDDKLDREDHEKYHKRGKFIPRYKGEPWEGKLTKFWIKQFAARGWEFGGSIYAVIRCSCCKANSRVLSDVDEKTEKYRIISELLEGDDDGIAAELEDLG